MRLPGSHRRSTNRWAFQLRRRGTSIAAALVIVCSVALAVKLWEQLQRCHQQLEDWQGPAATHEAVLSNASSAPGAQHSQQGKQEGRARVLVGVFTGFNPAQSQDPRYAYERRRQALRQTWFPATPQERARWEAELSIVVRFVIGHSSNAASEAALAAEERRHGDFLRLDVQEDYHQLPLKSRTFFVAAAALYPAVEWVVKVDDDVYLLPHRLLQAMGQWERMGAEYVGCMKHGDVWTKPGTRWYEPAYLIIGRTYYLHAYGSIYALRGRVVRDVVARNADTLRLLSNEDTTVGLWMLANNVKHFEDMRLCSPRCTAAAVGILDNGCAGLCNPLTDLLEVHEDPVCRQTTPDPLPYHHSYPEHTAFESMWVA